MTEFINTLKRLPPDSPGLYMVPWTIFLVAAEAPEPDQRQFLEGVLLNHYKRNGFANLPVALRFLQEVWSNQTHWNWAQALTELPVFVV